MNDQVLGEQLFPRLMESLREEGEVLVSYAYASQFARFLKDNDHELWLASEQEPGITDDDKARFYRRR